jgi:hypothetical protein
LDPDFQKDATDERDEGAVANALGDEDAAAAVNQVSHGVDPKRIDDEGLVILKY